MVADKLSTINKTSNTELLDLRYICLVLSCIVILFCSFVCYNLSICKNKYPIRGCFLSLIQWLLVTKHLTLMRKMGTHTFLSRMVTVRKQGNLFCNFTPSSIFVLFFCTFPQLQILFLCFSLEIWFRSFFLEILVWSLTLCQQPVSNGRWHHLNDYSLKIVESTEIFSLVTAMMSATIGQWLLTSGQWLIKLLIFINFLLFSFLKYIEISTIH